MTVKELVEQAQIVLENDGAKAYYTWWFRNVFKCKTLMIIGTITGIIGTIISRII